MVVHPGTQSVARFHPPAWPSARPDRVRAVRTDEELLEAWRAGDKRAGNELFQRHFEPIRRFFWNKVEREIEDLVQRTFMGCLEGTERFEGRSKFRTFLFAVAHNILREHFRQKRRDARVDLDERSVVDLGAGPSTVLAHRREQRLLLEGLRRIPITFQIALELFYWEKLTGAELGEVLGVPENTAYSRVRRAKELLTEALRKIERSRDVLESTTADLDGWAAQIRAGMALTSRPPRSAEATPDDPESGDETSPRPPSEADDGGAVPRSRRARGRPGSGPAASSRPADDDARGPAGD
jgi:RNA polymerase sigma factor (sigma-70 family)